MSFSKVRTLKCTLLVICCLMGIQVTAIGTPIERTENIESESYPIEALKRFPELASLRRYSCDTLGDNYSYAFSDSFADRPFKAFPYTLAVCRREINDNLTKLNLPELSTNTTLYLGLIDLLRSGAAKPFLTAPESPLRDSIKGLALQFFRIGLRYSDDDKTEKAEMQFSQFLNLSKIAFQQNPAEFDEFYKYLDYIVSHEGSDQHMEFNELRIMIDKMASEIAASNGSLDIEVKHRENLKKLYNNLGRYSQSLEEYEKIIALKELQTTFKYNAHLNNLFQPSNDEWSKDFVIFFERHDLAHAYKNAGLFEKERNELMNILNNSKISQDNYRQVATNILLAENSLARGFFSEAYDQFKIAKEKTLKLAHKGVLLAPYFGPAGGGYDKFPERLDFGTVVISTNNGYKGKDPIIFNKMLLAYIDMGVAQGMQKEGKKEWLSLFESAFSDLKEGAYRQENYFRGFYGNLLVEYAQALISVGNKHKAAELLSEAITLLKGKLPNPYGQGKDHPIVVEAERELEKINAASEGLTP